MTALVPRKGDAVAEWREPALDPRLELAIHVVQTPHPDIASTQWPRAAREAARTALERYQPLLVAADVDAVIRWLWPIADAVLYTPTEDEFMRRANALAIAASRLPHVAWTRQAQRNAMALCDRFPSVAQVLALVEPSVQPMLDRVAALKIIAEGVSQ